MEQPVRRRRRKKKNYTGLIVTLLAIILAGLVAILLLAGKADKKPDTDVNTGSQQSSSSESGTTEDTTGTTETTEETTETTEETTETTEETTETTEETIENIPGDDTVGGMIAQIAKAQVGKEYKYGGQGPNAFDASGFIQYCCSVANVDAPRLVPGQAEYGNPVSRENIAPGDVVVFWTDGYPDEAAYCGIYVGDDTFVYCSSSKGGVVEAALNTSYFEEHIFAVRRYY